MSGRVDNTSGLSSAQTAARLAAGGPNVLPVAPSPPAWRRLEAVETLGSTTFPNAVGLAVAVLAAPAVLAADAFQKARRARRSR